MARLEVKPVKILRDNYVYMVNHRASGTAAVIDPGIAGPVVTRLDEMGWRMRKVFCTHHHADQIGGNLDMVKSYHCEIIGPQAEADRIPGITTGVKGGDTVAIGDAVAKVIALPGHTSGHIGYWFESAKTLFCGDTLSPLGSGRLFEGNAAEMWESIKTIRAMPGDTEVYCSHEYAERNYKFARSVDRENQAIRAKGQKIRDDMAAGKHISVPFKLADEIALNPFLRADDPEMARLIDMDEGTDPVEVFAELRRRRDNV